MTSRITLILILILTLSDAVSGEERIRVGTFDIDASPPVGSPLAYDPTKGIESPLSCRGIVIVAGEQPVALIAVDWIGISNDGQTVFKERVADAIGTSPNRVVIHTLHQHDAPRCDFSAERMLNDAGLTNAGFDARFALDVARRCGEAAATALEEAKPVTHLGTGQGTVHMVASNRRILGPDGKVLHVRYTATKDPAIRAFPAGTIDPVLRMISFWNGDECLAALTYYACHPQSYYRTGLANPDFPGMARNSRQEVVGVPHIHFNGAGGNIGAGKWNDGAKENRQVLADRVAAGMKDAWESTTKTDFAADAFAWETTPVRLPVAKHLDAAALRATVNDSAATPDDRYMAAKKLTWLQRCERGETVDITCLHLGSARVLHMPGELFVEYQLAAQDMRPDLFVAMAAYGDYAPGYIGTEIGYSQGGYETSDRASSVSSDVEQVLMTAMTELLKPSKGK